MKNPDGRAVYVGKASNIKSRVRSYLRRGKDSRPQIEYLMREAASVDCIVTKDEHEALILENSLIKKHKPKFNIQLKDDKTYASLRLSMNEDFPRVSLTRRIRSDGASYFGPFAHGGALKRTAKIVQKLFTLRDCSNTKFKRHRNRPCLSYDMRLCSGPCASMIDKDQYRALCARAEVFLRGNRGAAVSVLKNKMKEASDEMRYEDASHYRDHLKALLANGSLGKVVSSNFTDKDVIEMEADERSFEFVVLFYRSGGITDKTGFSVKNTGAKFPQALGEFMGRFYDAGRQIPPEIVVKTAPEHRQSYEKWLALKRGGVVRVITPSRGLRAKLLRLASDNAADALRKKRFCEKKKGNVLTELKKSLKLSKTPLSIECLDISNIRGKQTTGSVVRFTGGEPDKQHYRRYRIKTVSGADDFASIKEMLSRRLLRANEEGWELPNLILIDGGKGQLSAAVETMKKFGFDRSTDIAAISKGRAKKQGDSIYTPRRKTPWTPVKNREGLFLLMRIRDEAHRFAIGYHKKLRKKDFLKSRLNTIPGVGEKREKILLNHFGSVERIKAATAKEISSLPGMNEKIAGKIEKSLR